MPQKVSFDRLHYTARLSDDRQKMQGLNNIRKTEYEPV